MDMNTDYLSTEVNCDFNLRLKTDFPDLDLQKFKDILGRDEACDYHFLSEASQFVLTQSEINEERRYDSFLLFFLILILSGRSGIWVNREISPEFKARYLSEFSVGAPGTDSVGLSQREFVNFRTRILNRRGDNFPKNFVQYFNDESIQFSRLILAPAIEPTPLQIAHHVASPGNIFTITLEFCHNRLVSLYELKYLILF